MVYCIAGNIKFGSWAPNLHTIYHIGFDGSVQDRHTYICGEEILADFNLAIWTQTAKFKSYQIFCLYGIGIPSLECLFEVVNMVEHYTLTW